MLCHISVKEFYAPTTEQHKGEGFKLPLSVFRCKTTSARAVKLHMNNGWHVKLPPGVKGQANSVSSINKLEASMSYVHLQFYDVLSSLKNGSCR